MKDSGQSALAAERMKRYIESHTTQRITAKALAEIAGYSPYHAARLFKKETGIPPFEYIRKGGR